MSGITTLRLLLASCLLAGTALISTAGPAHACFNPDEPTCRIRRAVCFASEPAAKYRDKVAICYP